MKYGDQTAYSIPCNLGKRSIALDLKSAAGREVLWRLIAGADVFVQGFRPGVIERLGFGYAAVTEREPRILYLSVSGFGQTGPLAERPAMDPVLQAFTGLVAENLGEDGVPHRVPIIAIDMSTALYAFSAVAAALHARRDEARGRLIEASLLQSAAGLQVVRMMQQYLEGGALRPPAGPSGVYQAADGWISVTVPRQHEWVAFCAAMDVAHLSDDPRFAMQDGRVENAEAMRAIAAADLRNRPGGALVGAAGSAQGDARAAEFVCGVFGASAYRGDPARSPGWTIRACRSSCRCRIWRECRHSAAAGRAIARAWGIIRWRSCGERFRGKRDR